ncbi:MAG TPA: PEGA domain-containing protein, partial [Caldimonas sp.]|nr:PEGA domain-containing protein [Caldimonas sp.]
AAPPAAASSINASDALLLATLVPTPMPPASADRANAPARPLAAPPASLSAPATAPHRDAPSGNGVATRGHTGTAAAPQRESARDRRAREAREARDREVASRAPAPVAPATGTVHIAISPWGQVEVDGAPSGAAPPLTELTLPEGRHRIVVRNGDFAPYVTSVNVTGGQTVSLRYKFGS